MQIGPRYDGNSPLTFDLPLEDPSVPTLRQRRRLGEALAGLDDRQWSTPTRCEGWAVRDVIAHLVGTNRFFTYSIASGLAGTPTRLLDGFDPVATPSAMVDAMSAQSTSELLDGYCEGTEALAGTIGGLDRDSWLLPAEAPPGHIAVHAVVLHALWDAWVHERDILLPLGLDQALEGDELTGCLRYAAALGPAYLATQESARTGTLSVEPTDVVPPFVVDIDPDVTVRSGPAPAGAAHAVGGAVELIEALSCRGPSIDLAASDRWMIEGLGVAYGSAAAS